MGYMKYSLAISSKIIILESILLLEYDSFNGIVKAVRDGDVFAGVMNSDVASYMQRSILDEQANVRLSFVRLLPHEQSVMILVPHRKNQSTNHTPCEQFNIKDIVEYLRRKYRRLLKVSLNFFLPKVC